MQSYNTFRRQEQLRHQRKRKKIFMVLFVVLVVLIFGVIGFLIFRPHYEEVKTVSVTASTDTKLALRWNKPEKATSFCVYWKTEGEDFEKAEGIKSDTYTITKLEQATPYTVCVSACYDDAESGRGTEHKVYTVASKPKIIYAESEKKEQITVKWKKNPKALSYVVQYKQSADTKYDSNNTVDVKKSAGCKATLKNLVEGASYDVRVCAVTSSGSAKAFGLWSTTSLSVRRVQRKLDPNKPMVALTFDDGPSYGTANDSILDTLEKYDVRATFFMIGSNVLEHPDNLKRKVNLGMELGNHTYAHTKYGESITADDIKKCSDAIKDVTGQYPTAFRSPGGMTTKTIKDECAKENMSLYLWNVDTEDWKSHSAPAIISQTLNNIQDGDIILMHEIYDATAEAIKTIIPRLIKKGYQIVSCQELIEYKTGEAPKGGVEYFSAHEAQ